MDMRLVSRGWSTVNELLFPFDCSVLYDITIDNPFHCYEMGYDPESMNGAQGSGMT